MKKLHLYTLKAKKWAKALGYTGKKELRYYVERAFESDENKNK